MVYGRLDTYPPSRVLDRHGVYGLRYVDCLLFETPIVMTVRLDRQGMWATGVLVDCSSPKLLEWVIHVTHSSHSWRGRKPIRLFASHVSPDKPELATPVLSDNVLLLTSLGHWVSHRSVNPMSNLTPYVMGSVRVTSEDDLADPTALVERIDPLPAPIAFPLSTYQPKEGVPYGQVMAMPANRKYKPRSLPPRPIANQANLPENDGRYDVDPTKGDIEAGGLSSDDLLAGPITMRTVRRFFYGYARNLRNEDPWLPGLVEIRQAITGAMSCLLDFGPRRGRACFWVNAIHLRMVPSRVDAWVDMMNRRGTPLDEGVAEQAQHQARQYRDMIQAHDSRADEHEDRWTSEDRDHEHEEQMERATGVIELLRQRCETEVIQSLDPKKMHTWDMDSIIRDTETLFERRCEEIIARNRAHDSGDDEEQEEEDSSGEEQEDELLEEQDEDELEDEPDVRPKKRSKRR